MPANEEFTAAQAPQTRRFLLSKVVMAMFGYTNRSSFHQWVRNAGVPCVRLNARKLVFDEAALNAWIESRSSTGKAS